MKLIEKAMTPLLVLLVLVPGVYGVNFGVVSGNGASSGLIGVGIGAAKDASVNAGFSMNGAILKPTISITGIGSIDENHQVTDSNNNHAEVHAKVANGLDIQYTDMLTPGEGDVGDNPSGSVEAAQTLTVGQSDYIKCSQIASNLIGDQASSGIEIKDGSLSNYHGNAHASDGSYASELQAFDNARGKDINVEDGASNYLGATKTRTKIKDGTISNYISDYVRADSVGVGFVVVRRLFGDAAGKEIELESSAIAPDGAKSSVNAEVKGTNAQDGDLSGYNGAAALGNYWDEAASQQSFSSASGSEILLDASSSNDEKGKKSSISTEIKSGSAIGYGDVTGSGLSYGSMLHAGGHLNIASGNRIEIQASFDYVGDKASVDANVENGAINGATMTALGDYFGQTSASQTANSVKGNKLKLDAMVKIAKYPEVQKDSTVINPNTAFHNTASITDGTPKVDQGTP